MLQTQFIMYYVMLNKYIQRERIVINISMMFHVFLQIIRIERMIPYDGLMYALHLFDTGHIMYYERYLQYNVFNLI